MEADTTFEHGDELATAGDKVALEYGWWANEWMPGFLSREAAISDADPNSRAAFSYALTKLEERHGRYLSLGQITDRIRIGRAFPRADYDDLKEELHYPFSFSQLRAAYIKDGPQETMALLLWAAEHDSTPQQIYARKMGGCTETAEEKAKRHFGEWAMKYLDRCDHKDVKLCLAARIVIRLTGGRNGKAQG